MSGVRGKVVLKIFGTDLIPMRQTLERCLTVLAKVPGIVDLGLYRDTSVPQLQVSLDRPALARAGISVNAAQDVIETALGGKVATTLWEKERPVPVRVMFPAAERQDEAHIGDILVPAVGGGQFRCVQSRASTRPSAGLISAARPIAASWRSSSTSRGETWAR